MLKVYLCCSLSPGVILGSAVVLNKVPRQEETSSL